MTCREAIEFSHYFADRFFLMASKRQSNFKTSDSNWNPTKWTENFKRSYSKKFYVENVHLIFTEKFCKWFKNQKDQPANIFPFHLEMNRHFIKVILWEWLKSKYNMKSTKWNRYCSYIFYLLSILKNESFHCFKNLSSEQGESFIPHLKMNPYPGI